MAKTPMTTRDLRPFRVGSLVTDRQRIGLVQAHRPPNMVDVLFEQTVNGAGRRVVERWSVDRLQPVVPTIPRPQANPAKGLRTVIRAWEATPQARPMLPVLRGVVLTADFTPDKERRIPDDFLPDVLVDGDKVQLVKGRDGTVVLLASDSPRRGAGSVRAALTSGRTLRLTGPRGGLSEGQRAALPTETFAIPERRAWPINDRRHAEIAVQYMKRGFGKKSEYPRVKAEIRRRYPDVPVSNPAGQDFQDPENIQFRRVVAGITRSLVRKKLGMPTAPRSEDMTDADLRREEALFLSLSPADRRSITSQAYAIATRQGQKHGWLKAGTQQPTAKAAARSEERMLLDPLEAQKDRYYEVVLAGQRKSGFYRVVPREVAGTKGVELRYYIEPAEDPAKPKYFLSPAKAEARKDEMNAALAMGQKPILRNPSGTDPTVLFKDATEDPFMALAAEVNNAIVPVTSEPEDFVPSPEAVDRFKTLLGNIAQNIERGAGNRESPIAQDRPFFDIERIELRQEKRTDMFGTETEVSVYRPVSPETPPSDTQKIRFVLYLPKNYKYLGTRQMAGGASLLTPESRIREELGTRTSGRGESRYQKEVPLPYSQEARWLSKAINVPDEILQRFFSPFGTRSQMWEKYKKEKNFMRKRGLRPTMAKMWMRAPKSDSLNQAARGRFDEKTRQFVDRVSQNYIKFFTTNIDLFLFTIENFRTPGLAFATQNLALLLQDAQDEAAKVQAQLKEQAKYAKMTDEERVMAKLSAQQSSSNTYIVPVVSLVPSAQRNIMRRLEVEDRDIEAIRSMNLGLQLPSMEDMGKERAALDRLVERGTPTREQAARAVIQKNGGFFIPGLGGLVVFPTLDSATDWLQANAVRLQVLIREIMRFPKQVIEPITAAGVPFSGGRAVMPVLETLVEMGYRTALERGAAAAEVRKDLSALKRRVSRLSAPQSSTSPPPEPLNPDDY